MSLVWITKTFIFNWNLKQKKSKNNWLINKQTGSVVERIALARKSDVGEGLSILIHDFIEHNLVHGSLVFQVYLALQCCQVAANSVIVFLSFLLWNTYNFIYFEKKS